MLRLLRPHQWLKNLLVFAGVFFAHGWEIEGRITQAVILFAAFCATASAIYMINDVLDRNIDRRHPKKKHRPIAAGLIDPRIAVLNAHILLAVGWVLAFYSAGWATLFWVGTYTVINLGYCRWFKHWPIVDVTVLSGSYLVRLLAGTDGLGIPVSSWLLLCGLSGALILGFGKRLSEKTLMEPEAQRVSVGQYTHEFLGQAITISATLILVFYGLYCLDDGSMALHGRRLILTYPWIVLAVFRYLQIITSKNPLAEDPATLFLKDRLLLVLVVGWFASFAGVLLSPQ